MLAALLRRRELKMSSREGSGQMLIFWAVLMTLCRALLSTAEQLAYRVEVEYASILSMEQRYKDTRSFSSGLFYLRILCLCILGY